MNATATLNTFAGARLHEDLSQFSGYGYSASGTARRLRELLEDPSKFKVFAFISCLLCPNASKQFRRLRYHQEFRTKHFKRTGRELKRGLLAKHELRKRVEHIGDVAEDLWWFPNATAHSISPTRPPFNPPHWTGDSTEGLVAVPLPESNVLSLEEATRLVRELGYDARAAFASIPRPLWMNAKPDRRRIGVFETDDGEWMDRTHIAQPLPYVAPIFRGTTQGFFSKKSVQRAIAKSRTKKNSMRLGVLEVVFQRQSPTEVAKKYRLDVEALKKSATRTRQRILKDVEIAQPRGRDERKSNENEGFEADVSTLLLEVGTD